MNIAESIKQQTIIKQQLVCTYDDFSVDSYMNRVLKATMELLLRYDITKARKKELRNLLFILKMLKQLMFIVLIGGFNIIEIIVAIKC